MSIDNFKEVVRAHKKVEQLTRELLYEFIERIDVFQRIGNREKYAQRIITSPQHRTSLTSESTDI